MLEISKKIIATFLSYSIFLMWFFYAALCICIINGYSDEKLGCTTSQMADKGKDRITSEKAMA